MDLELSASLERALLAELLAAWKQSNEQDFEESMRAPVMILGGHAALGRFVPRSRELSLQRALVLTGTWGQVLEVLRHEMAHQYVHEVLGVHDESPHGPSFRQVCRERGIDARAAGLPDALAGAPEQRLVRRVRALLRLAESPEPHEAAAAAQAARRLLATHDLDLRTREDRYTFQQVGPTKARFDPWEKVLGGVLSTHFGVECIYALAYRPDRGTWGRVLELLGPTHHVEVAAYVHDVLRATGERAWREHKRTTGLRKNAERRSYLFGLIDGFRESLDAEIPAGETGLVHVEAAAMEGYVRRRYPRLRRGRSRKVKLSSAAAAGKAIGRTLQIRPGVSTTGGAPKALPGE